MKLQVISRLRKYMVPALAALTLGFGIASCSSDGDTDQPDASLASEDGNNAANGENANLNGEGNLANGDASANSSDNAAGNELQNLVNEGGADTANNDSSTANAGTDAGADPFAANAAGGDGSDPFAAANAGGATNAPPANALGGTNAPPANAFGNATNAGGTANTANANTNNGNYENNGSNNSNNEDVANDDGSTNDTASNQATAVASAPGALPENGAKMAYYIRPGDTMAIIAQQIYGNKAKWKELASQNNIVDPNRIYAGDVIYYTLNDQSKSFADRYETAAKKAITVASGDTLSHIAQRVYGSESEWRTLWKENPQLRNPDLIKAGMVLTFRDLNSVKNQAYNTGDDEEVVATDDEVTDPGLMVGATE